MKLGVHESFSKVGLGVINKRLALTDKGDRALLNAFFLGNWMTDIVSPMDPAAHATVYSGVKGLRDWLKKKAGDSIVKKYLTGLVTRKLKVAQDLLDEKSAHYIGPFLKDVTFVVGYFKFVNPSRKQRLLPYDYYKHIFHKLYSMYLPHKHFDRWPVKIKIDRERMRYAHVAEAVKHLAEVYSKVDRDWARPTCRKGVPQDDAGRREWSYNLALLGHGLHTTEDFFAHTNFVEKILEDAYHEGRWKRPTDKRELWLHDRRLRQYDGTNADEDTDPNVAGTVPYERAVVGGTFDFVDTLFSLKSMLFTKDKRDKNSPGTPPAVDVVLKILDGTKDVSDTEAREMFSWVDPEIRKKILDLHKVSAEFKKHNPFNWTLVRAIQEVFILVDKLLSFEIVPVKILKEWLKEMAGNALADYVGKSRLGCHSLLHKDDDSVLHGVHAANLAKAMHSYIVEVLLRWSRPSQLAGTRHAEGSSGAPAGKSQTKADTKVWVDWQQLLDFFLCSPCRPARMSNQDPPKVFKKFLWYDVVRSHAIPMTIGGRHFHTLAYVDKGVVDERAKLKMEDTITAEFKKEAKTIRSGG